MKKEKGFGGEALLAKQKNFKIFEMRKLEIANGRKRLKEGSRTLPDREYDQSKLRMRVGRHVISNILSFLAPDSLALAGSTCREWSRCSAGTFHYTPNNCA